MSTMQDYRQITFALSNDLRLLLGYSKKLELGDIAQQVEEIRQRIENHTFSIAVVGEFKRGKSTFINALLGQEILPADILPTSATLNRVTFGLEPMARLFFKRQPGEPERVEEISISQLADYITKLTPEAEALAATIREAVIYYPVPYCRIYNMDIIDTPGLSDEAFLTEVTLSVLPKVDAAIFVIMADAPFSDSEGAFLEQLLTHGLGRVIFAVTALDRIKRTEDRRRVTQDVLERIEKRIRGYAEAEYGSNTPEYDQYLKQIGQARVFGLSGYQAVEAKRTNDANLLRESCFIEFEDELKRFLTEESDTLALRSRATQISMAGQEILKAIEVKITALELRREKYQMTKTIATALLETVQQMGKVELHQVSEVQGRLKDKTRPLTTQRLLLAQGTMAKIQSSLQLALGTLLNIPLEIHNTVTQEVNRLQPFAITFDRVIQHLNLLTTQMEADWSNGISNLSERKMASLLSMIGNREGYGLPLESLPKKLAELITVDEITKQIESGKISIYLDEVFDQLKQPIDTALHQGQDWLMNLYTRDERIDVLAERELRDLKAIYTDTEKICTRSQKLSQQITGKTVEHHE